MRSIGILVAVACATWAGACASERCALPAPEVLWSEGPDHAPGGKRLVRYDVADGPLWTRPIMPRSHALDAFRAAIEALPDAIGRGGHGGRGDVASPERSARIDLRPEALLDRAIARGADAPTLANLRVARRLAATAIQPMRCLEAALLADQAERLDMLATPSEVLALILRSADGTRLRIYALTVNAPGIGGVGRVRDAVQAEVDRGYRLWVALHNHNFFVDPSAKDGVGAGGLNGVVAPSAPDVEALRGFREDLGMAEAWITNGFHTGHWSASALDAFSPP